jgi:hypothetical protein
VGKREGDALARAGEGGADHGDLGGGGAAWVVSFAGGGLEMGDGRWEMVMLEWAEGEVDIL